MNGVPSSLSIREVAALRRWAEGRRVVEAGALLGFSAIHLAQVASTVVSVDRHEGYTAPTLRQFMSNLDRLAVRHLVRPVVGDALLELPSIQADLAFIDLTGTQQITLGAIRAANARLIAIHDLCRPRCGGVEAAIREAGLKVVEHVDSLAICERRQ